MPVNIIKASPTGGGVNISLGSQTRQFRDTFQRANNANIGKTWLDSLIFSGSVGVSVVAQILTNHLHLTCGTASSRVGYSPIPLSWMSQVNNLSQFAELTISAQNTTSWDMELAVVWNPQVFAGNVAVGYYALVISPSAVPGSMFQFSRVVYSGVTNVQPTFTSLGPAFGSWSVGDVIRLSAVNNGSGQWTLSAKQNGSSIGTPQTDSTLTLGQPAFVAALTGTTVSIDISEFSGGVGS